MPILYDIIAFDLDGTLTPSKSPLESDMAEILCQLLAKYKVAVISGASYKQFQEQFLAHLACPAELAANLFILPANGSTFCVLNGSTDWTCTTDSPFTDPEKQEIYAAFGKAFTETGFTKPEKPYGPILEDRTTQVTFSAWGMQAPLAVKLAWDPDHLKRQKIVQVLKPLLPKFSIHIGGATSIDITRAGIDKAYGLKKLLKELQVSPERMLYIGDELFPDGNDAPALTVGVVCHPVKGPEETKTFLRTLL